VQIAQLLEAAGVHVPRVLEVDVDAGLMLVTDLGTAPSLKALTEAGPGPQARALMRDAIDALIRVQLASREGVLPPFDDAFLHREMELMPEWYLERHLGRKIDEVTRGMLDRTFALLSASALAQP
jgi:aminoglycoside/choline kinase family phosphotransferase